MIADLRITGDEALRVRGEFTWSEDSPAALMDIDVSVPAGSFVAIVGSTGEPWLALHVVLNGPGVVFNQ